MANIVYIKKVDEYDDILKEKHKKIPKSLKKIIFMLKNMFNIITKKKIENENIWILPIQEKYSNNKINNIIKKIGKYSLNTYVISDDLKNNEIIKLMNKYNVSYIEVKSLKKYLVIKMLEYINKIKNEEFSSLEITILVNEVSEYIIYLIEELSKKVKNIKIVSSNIYKFKKLEERLYNEHGIAIQFSNSYKKSLVKSKIIINLDFNVIDINEYDIFNNAIVVNLWEDNIKIKSKLFNGIVINSCNISFKKEIREKFKKIGIYHKYNSLVLYQSKINDINNFEGIIEKLEEDKVLITSLIGNNGIINKNEIKNILKKLDK